MFLVLLTINGKIKMEDFGCGCLILIICLLVAPHITLLILLLVFIFAGIKMCIGD